MTGRLLAEALGTALLLYIIVGSGIAAETLGTAPAFQLLAHALSVGLGLGVLVALFQTVSGSHFNPSVTLAFWRDRTIDGSTTARYILAQIVGAIAGVVVAHLTFTQPAIATSATDRDEIGLIGAEAISTFVLVLVILALVRTGRPGAIPIAVGAWVAAIVFATSSTGFTNPAVTIARTFTSTYTGIAPGSVLGYLTAQVLAAFAAAVVAVVFYPGNVRQNVPD